MGPFSNIQVFACVCTFLLWNNIQPSVENEFIANYSSRLLTNVPKTIPVRTQVLDLSHNRISGLSTSEFISLSDLQVLNLSHNLITELDFGVFFFNQDLEHLDLSHNNILKVYCLTLAYLRHLDLSFNKFSALGSMKVLTLEHVRNKVYYFNQELLYRQFSEMPLASLTIFDASMPHMLCPNRTSSFQYLNFSHNALTDELFQNCGTLTDLKFLILQRNKFESLPKVSFMTSGMKSLKFLDVSSNLLSYDAPAERCRWAESLSELDLSSNQLTDAVFECLPVNVQKLDLQNNQITSVPRRTAELKSLRELNLASNRLADLPGCGGFPSLEFLNVEMNLILTPLVDFFESCPRVRELQGGHNPFKCSCELQAFVRLERRSGGKLFGWPGAYVCEYPEELRGRRLEDFHLAELACNTTLLLVTWTQTKRRAWHDQPEEQEGVLQFHAFISYSERDAPWVKNELMPNLERGEGCVQLCQHERNFIPGKSIVENIITCIEKSYRSIFVLSPNFVQSEWCHYELYFAHHKLFSETSNSLILILLEPIPPYVIPARYHKLKALMAKRTYLEWPKEKSKQALFWANLRAAINLAGGQRC
uniref:Toll-like receptor n=1 Tax=Calidris pygmaea TaxID=425635 RepID=A0A8C3JBX0_9CHAR